MAGHRVEFVAEQARQVEGFDYFGVRTPLRRTPIKERPDVGHFVDARYKLVPSRRAAARFGATLVARIAGDVQRLVTQLVPQGVVVSPDARIAAELRVSPVAEWRGI